ncbi:NF-kappa-B essential modulator isoform X3 [Drosophila guanche]|uniref:Blast:Peroxisomal leader peptide-processing protease n=1 Tax=Drosophila guanche TaxID=7266 RepID=A0A3B0JMJ4_DROGU|nr:NF-kappa-B essential modulator isoform X3 [Drosophila guanche]SPP74516.1 blast:Peroxisomal leader peptide-processing protease [Drosophila guanche]
MISSGPSSARSTMSKEESFVILGSSPVPSLCTDSLLLDDAMDASDRPVPVTQESYGADVSAAGSSSGPLSTSVDSDRHKSLAASFIMGEVKSDVLKNSVYSQFPSLCSMQASAEDVVKLQNMMEEYVSLKKTLDMVNRTMMDYHKLTQQWRQEAADREEKCKQQLTECQEQVEKLRAENQALMAELETKLVQIELVQDIRQKEQDELRQSVSEKTSLINNMRVEIDKLQQINLNGFEFVPDDDKKKAKEEVSNPLNYVQREEHDRQIQKLQRDLSKMLAEKLEVIDMKKVYIQEIDCLKVNLTSAEELMHKMERDINQLKARDIQRQEEIEHLQTQNEIYRRDFEMERADREKNAGEKEQYLLDLRSLQRRNQELIEALAESHKSPKSGSPSPSTSGVSSLREDQRPVRVLDPNGADARPADSALRCPICSKGFNSLSVLQSHVNDCLDKI